MIDSLDKVAFFKKQPSLQKLPEGLLRELADGFQWKIIPASQVVIREGEPGNTFFWLHTGHLEVTSREQVIGWVNPGDLVGEISLLGEQAPVATLTARQDALLLATDFDRMRRLMERSPHLSAFLAKMAINRLTSQQRTELHDQTSRIAILLLFDDPDLKRVVLETLRSLMPHCRIFDTDRLASALSFDPAGEWSPGQHIELITTLAAMEKGCQHALYVADTTDNAWTNYCIRQSSRSLVVALNGDDPSVRAVERNLWNRRGRTTGGHDPELLLLNDQAQGAEVKHACLEWLKRRHTARFTEVDRLNDQLIVAVARRLMAPHPRLKRLSQISLFEGIDEENLTIVATSLENRVVRAGEILFREGEEANSLVIIEAGRFTTLRNTERIGELGVGDVAGEMGLVEADTKRTATLVAKRDSLVLTLDRSRFEMLKKRLPRIQDNLARIMVSRINGTSKPGSPSALTLALVPLFDDPGQANALERFLHHFKKALETMGSVSVISARYMDLTFGVQLSSLDEDDQTITLSAEWLQCQEQMHDFLILVGDPHVSRWNGRIIRQADQVLHVGMGSQDPQPGAVERQAAEILDRRNDVPHLVLLHPADARSGRNTRSWLAARPVRRHYHVRHDHPGDAARVARFLTNSAIGLVLTGVSSRVICHVGVLKALQERGIPVDMVVGVSSGAGAAAMAAMGWPWEKTRDHILKIGDEAIPKPAYFTLPYVALMHGIDGEKTLKYAYGDARFEDQFIPCKVMAVDLRNSELVAIDEGEIWLGVRASGSLPVFWPPVSHNGRVLVDGGMLNNTPLQYLEEVVQHGWTLVSDPNPTFQPFSEVAEYGASLSGWKVLWERLKGGNPKRYPTLGEIIVQGMCIESFHQQAIADQRKGADNTLFFDMGVDSTGYFGFLEGDKLIDLMNSIHEAAMEKLDTYPELLDFVAGHKKTRNKAGAGVNTCPLYHSEGSNWRNSL